MNGYPLVDELEVTVRAGRGIAIIVEGQNAEEDPWFYGQWFGDRARQVTFFPQDGWARVIEAVVELRRRCLNIPVYGIIDRDFTAEEALDADFATSGILRTPFYTLENYLLDPACWAVVFRFLFRRQGGAPDGWDRPERVQDHIKAAYRACLDLAAYNMVIKYGSDSYPELARATAERDRSYRDHPDAFKEINPISKLTAWGDQMGCSENLGTRFHEHRAALESASVAEWQKVVSGKYVLHVLQGRFPLLPGTGKFGLPHYLNLYLDKCPDPPSDLVTIVNRIIRDGGRMGSQQAKGMSTYPDYYIRGNGNPVPEAQFDTSHGGLGWACEVALRGSRERVFTVVVKSFNGERTDDNLKTVRELAVDATRARIKAGRFKVGGYYCYRWEPEGPNVMPLTEASCEDISPGPFRSP